MLSQFLDKLFLDHPKWTELIRFGIVGSVALLILYAVYYLLLSFCGHNASYSLGYTISMIVNYLLTVSFTFKVKSNSKKCFGFAFSHLVNYLMQIACLNLFIWIGMAEAYAPIPVFAICVPINFLLVRWFIKK